MRNQASYIDTGDICATKHKGNAASRDAFERSHARHANDRDEVLELVRSWSSVPSGRGITSKEVAELMDKPLHSVSGRLAELKRDGKIRETGARRDGAAVLMACDGEQSQMFGGAA